MGVSKNRVFPPKSSILIGFSFINHPFWGTPIFGNTQVDQNLVSIAGRIKREISARPSGGRLEVSWAVSLAKRSSRGLINVCPARHGGPLAVSCSTFETPTKTSPATKRTVQLGHLLQSQLGGASIFPYDST